MSCFAQEFADPVLLTDKHDGNAVLSSRLDRAIHFDFGRMVAAHGINGDFDHRT